MTSQTDESWPREVAEYLEQEGYTTEVGKSVGHHRIDVWAEKTDGDSEMPLAIDCRTWDHPVPHTAIRNIKTKTDSIGAKPGIAYTSELTDDAKALAEKWGFKIISPEDL